MTYRVFGGTLSLTQSINQSLIPVSRRTIEQAVWDICQLSQFVIFFNFNVFLMWVLNVCICMYTLYFAAIPVIEDVCMRDVQ